MTACPDITGAAHILALAASRKVPAPHWTPALVGACGRLVEAWLVDTGQRGPLAALRDVDVQAGGGWARLGDLIDAETAAAGIDAET